MRLYTGIGETNWNGYEIPASIGYACVSPVSGRTEATKKQNYVSIPDGVQVIQDSGAFSDSWSNRLELAEAWDRQVEHAEKHLYSDKISHRASYDLLIDETWHDGKRSKQRWTYQDACQAVETTIEASQFAAARCDGLGLVQSAQGVEPHQYLECVKSITPYINPDKDKLGLGGWCILGIRRELMPTFEQTIKLVLPFASNQGIKSVHIWGVIYPVALGLLLYWCDEYGLEVSTDSTSPVLKVIRGEWGYSEWRHKIDRISSDRIGAARIIHNCQVKHYLAMLRDTKHYVSHFAAETPNNCVMCGKPITGKSTTCGQTCRKRKSRMSQLAVSNV